MQQQQHQRKQKNRVLYQRNRRREGHGRVSSSVYVLVWLLLLIVIATIFLGLMIFLSIGVCSILKNRLSSSIHSNLSPLEGEEGTEQQLHLYPQLHHVRKKRSEQSNPNPNTNTNSNYYKSKEQEGKGENQNNEELLFPNEFIGSSTLLDKNSEEEKEDEEEYAFLGGKLSKSISMRYTEWKNGDTPYKITPTIQQRSNDVANQRKNHIKNAMIHAWNGYKMYAFGADEIMPVSGGHNNDNAKKWGGIGTTLVDSLDTLWIMGMKREFYEARDWVRDELNHDIDVDVSVFETTIRNLGGLLSAYTWSNDESFLLKANDLGRRLIRAFPSADGDGDDNVGNGNFGNGGGNDDQSLGIPSGFVNLRTGRRSNADWTGLRHHLSELGTLQLEFRDLAFVTKNKEYAQKTEHIFQLLKDIEPNDGLFPYLLSSIGGRLIFETEDVSFGAYGDSFFEYELKLWLQGGRKEMVYREMYDKSMDGMHTELLRQSTSGGLWYISSRNNPMQSDHLTCFMGGLLALGAYTDPRGLDSDRSKRDLRTAKRLAYTCYQMYAQMPTGLAAEVTQFFGMGFGERGSLSVRANEAEYRLRPETIETFFILHQLTGDPIYRTWGWEIFQSIEKYCKTEYAYGSYPNVQNTGLQPHDSMESFFMGETLKYMYLLHDPDSDIDILNKHVFNTEAHPLEVKNFQDSNHYS